MTVSGTAALGAILLTAPLLAQKLARIEKIEAASSASATKIYVELDGAIDIRSERIENPARVFVDFKDAKPGLAVKGPYAQKVGDSFVKQIRVAENQKGVTRVVLDLAREDVEFRTSVAGPNRLLIEIQAVPSVAGKMKNPLAGAPLAVPPIPASSTPATPVNVAKKAFKMPDPPKLSATYKLPKGDVTAVPFGVSGFGAADAKASRQTATPISKQASAPAVAAARTSNGKSSLTRVLGLKIGRVVIDAGHGGHDVGSTGPNGLNEKDLTLDVAKRLGELIEENLGSEIIYTRSDDRFVQLEERGAIANRSKADLFISIHANSSQTRTATGVETYYLNFTSSPEALEVAARENAVGERSVNDLGDLIKKIALKDKIDESREFAAKVQSALHNGASKAGNRTKDRGVRKAPFIVLIGAAMPSILTEIGFLSNPKEEALLRKTEYRQKIAESLYKGIAQYTDTLSHFNVARGSSVLADGN